MYISVSSNTSVVDPANQTATGVVDLNNSDVPSHVCKAILDSKATANPIVLLLIALIFVPLLRFKKD